MSDPTSEVLLDLAQPRVVVLTDRGRQFVLKCRRITDEDWLKFFGSISVTSEQLGLREVVNVTDTDSPRIALAQNVLVDAEGYKVEGLGHLTQLTDWQSKIPLAHRSKLGEVLSDARPIVGAGDFDISLEGEVVTLYSTWTASPVKRERKPEDAEPETRLAMHRIDGLKHIFDTPSEEQYRAYQRAANRVKVVGGSRSGKTVYMGAHVVLGELYDELIRRVEGYCVNGVPLVSRDLIVREMDLHHKVIAAQMLFLPQSQVEIAEDAPGEKKTTEVAE